jgi:ABC-type glutathione transport system ATPase component
MAGLSWRHRPTHVVLNKGGSAFQVSCYGIWEVWNEVHEMLQRSLAWIMAGWTTVAIAHRLSTLRRAHEVLVTDQGRIVERGTHSGHWRLKGTTPASTGGSSGLIVRMLE